MNQIVLGKILRSKYIFEVTVGDGTVIIVHADSYKEAHDIVFSLGIKPFRVIQRPI